MYLEVNETNLYYETAGMGPPMLLLHGNGEDHHIFDRLASRLQRHYSIYAVDSRGHGQSAATNRYDYAIMSEDVRQLILALALDRVHIVGFSDGAIVALMLAMDHPEAVEKMALLGINLSPTDFIPECLSELMEAYKETQDPLVRLMLEQPNITLDQVRCVRTPTLIVGGQHDIFRPGLYQELAGAMIHSQLIIMEGHDHDSYITGQDLLYPYLEDFFR